MPGSHEAHQEILAAIRGDEIDPRNMAEHHPENVQGGHGSANIPLLHAVNAAWYWHHRNDVECRKVLQAWRGYFGLRLWHTKEPYGVFRYQSWILLSYVAMYALCIKRGDTELADQFARYIRYELLTAVLSCGWKRGRGIENNHHDVLPVATGGARSWVAQKVGDHYVERPYVWLTDWSNLGYDLANMLRTGSDASWELEPILRLLVARGSARWPMFSTEERQLCERLIGVKSAMDDSELDDLESLLGLISATGARAKIPVVFIKTNRGVGWLAERSAASGSTSFKYGAVWCDGGRVGAEYPESWASQIPVEWGWLNAGGHARKSDPGGEGWLDVHADRVVLNCQTGDGVCANGFRPGDDHHYEQWRGWVQDGVAWKPGPRSITLPGAPVWIVRIREMGRGIEMLHPTGAEYPVDDPPDHPLDRPGTGRLRAARRSLEDAEIRWNAGAGPRQARRAIRQIEQALARRGQ